MRSESAWVALALLLLLLCPSPSQALRGHTWLHETTAATHSLDTRTAEQQHQQHGHITYYTQHPSNTQPSEVSVSQTALHTDYGCPKDPVFNDPWVMENVVLTYAGRTRDGLGSQVLRMMSVYAAAAALGLRYVHTPLHCIGHFGLITYRNSSCDDVDPAMQQMMSRLSKFMSLPTTLETAADVSTWDRDAISGNWTVLAQRARRALLLQQPTVIQLEGAHVLAWSCPGMFHHVPDWRPSAVSSSGGSSSSSGGGGGGSSNGGRSSSSSSSQAEHELQSAGQQQQQQHWLLDRSKVVRIAVHQRRGDVAVVAAHGFRYLPVVYYLNVVKDVVKVVQNAQLDFTVEWYTEASATPSQHEEIARIRKEVPNLTLVFDSDILWTWQHMATADVLIMSLSAFSIVPAIVNRDGLILRAPPSQIPCAANTASRHWLEPRGDGTLEPAALKQLEARFPATAVA